MSEKLLQMKQIIKDKVCLSSSTQVDYVRQDRELIHGRALRILRHCSAICRGLIRFVVVLPMHLPGSGREVQQAGSAGEHAGVSEASIGGDETARGAVAGADVVSASGDKFLSPDIKNIEEMKISGTDGKDQRA